MKHFVLLLLFLICCHTPDKSPAGREDVYNKYLEKHLLFPNNPRFDTTTELGKLQQDYDDLVRKYVFLKRKISSDSFNTAKLNTFLKLVENPGLFDGDTVPCGAPLGVLGHRIGTPLHIKGIISEEGVQPVIITFSTLME